MITLIDESYLTDAYKEIIIAEGSHAYIIDDDGKVISSLNTEEIDTTIADSALVSKIIEASSNDESFHADEK